MKTIFVTNSMGISGKENFCHIILSLMLRLLVVIREVALHGVRHGAAMALAVAQARSGHELWLLPHGFLATEHPEDHERLVKDFSNTANSVALTSQAE